MSSYNNRPTYLCWAGPALQLPPPILAKTLSIFFFVLWGVKPLNPKPFTTSLFHFSIAMASMASRTNPLLTSLPQFLTWRSLGFRTVCMGRLGFATQSQLDADPPATVAGTKVLETVREEFEIGSRLITLETGKIARFANGAVVLGMDETKVLSTVAAAKGNDIRDFLPLTVRVDLSIFS